VQRLLNTFWPWLLAVVCLVLSSLVNRTERNVSVQDVQSQLEIRVQQSIKELNHEASLIKAEWKERSNFLSADHTFLFWINDSLVSWNKSLTFIPPVGSPKDSVYWIQSQALKAIAVNFPLTDSTWVTGIIPLQFSHKVLGRSSFPEYNEKIFQDLKPEIFPPNEPGGQVVYWQGKALFSINLPSTVSSPATPLLSWLLLLLTIIIFLVFPLTWIGVWRAVKNSLVIIGIRLFMVYGELPGTSSSNPLFDPKVFASSSLNDSAGNFLLNTLALFFIVNLFLELFPKPVLTRKLSPRVSFLKNLLIHSVTFGALLLPVLYLETIYHHAVLTPDVTQSFVFSIERLALIASAVCSGWIAFLVLRKVVPHLLNAIHHSTVSYFLSLGGVLLLIILYQFFSGRNHELALLATVMLSIFLTTRWWPVIKKWNWIRSRLTLDYLTVIGLSLIFSVVIADLDTEKNRKYLLRLGSSMIQQREEFTEYLLRQAIQEIAGDASIRILNDDPLSDKKMIRERIERKFPPGYFTDESPQFYYFDQSGSPLPGTRTSQMNLLSSAKAVWETSNGVIFLDTAATTSLITRRYLAVVRVGDYNRTTIALEVIDRYLDDSDIPVLQAMITDDRGLTSINPGLQLSVATYNEGALLNTVGVFNYLEKSWSSSVSNLNASSENSFVFNEYLHLFLNESNSRMVVLSTPYFDSLRWTTNFFFALFVALVLIALSWLLRLLLSAWQGVSLSYSDRIRLYLFGVFAVPVLLIAFFVIRSVDQDAQDKALQNIQAQSEQVASDLGIWLTTGADEEFIRSKLSEAGRSFGLDFLFYDAAGRRYVSGNPKLLESSLMPVLRDPQVLQASAVGNRFFHYPDRAGNLTYLACWLPVYDPVNGSLLGHLSVPDFRFYQRREEQRIRIISVIIYVIVPVFLLFLVLSYAMVYNLTRPLLSVSRALKKTTLNRVSPAGQDEMGLMVSEYNRMVENLDRSRQELVRQQRELAWREMARQVAHEIRNPLTPIKLTIQRLLVGLKSGRVEATDAEKSLQSVLIQTEVLSEIANSFSSLAGLPALQYAQIDLTMALKEDISLFYSAESGQIKIQSPSGPVWIWFDRKFLSRVVSNLVLNARQSADYPVDIHINITLIAGQVRVSFSDNGLGITKENADRIFSPYFTTKSSGTGLGLWLIKQGMEQSGGKIWFESAPGKGTTFSFELPLIDR